MKTFNRRTLFVLLLLFTPLIPVNAQQQHGTITGRVVTEDGAPLPGITVMLVSNSNSLTSRSFKTSLTDEDGNFQFTNLTPRGYSISVTESRGYVQPLRPSNLPRLVYRIGENAVIRMMRGGVITGKVTYTNGEPIIGIYVSAIRIRDADGAPVRTQNYSLNRITDDRGIYRIYSLQPGTYVVAANHSVAAFNSQQSPFDGDSPTYHPSTTRDTAAEIQVVAGAETSGVDIRHRGERGHIISGKITGDTESAGPVTFLTNVILTTFPAGMQAGMTASRPGENNSGFAFLGIPDGEYELMADRGSSTGDDSWRSEPRRVTVRGGDVTGIEIRLLPMASIAGRVVIEQTPNACDPKAKTSLEELTLNPRREEKPTDSPAQTPRFTQIFSPNEKGEFKMNALAAGRYRIEMGLPNENWFVKSVASASSAETLTRPTAKSPPTTNLVRSGALLKSGDKLSGVTVTIADGAASLRGKVAAKEGSKLPASLRIHLVPAEATAAEDVLRYGEALTNDGSFAFTNFAPGKYWIVAKAIADNDSPDRLPSPSAWDSAERAKLRKEAEAAKNEIELKSCQRVKDHVLKFEK
ncbi:MAG: carboxypeptidase regulatory-like domain-containing protein [Acidobacteria bacterium]|nr:carboxypeptidase regulatory-like domain-containing protein [Acidobacteriota bacterium]